VTSRLILLPALICLASCQSKPAVSTTPVHNPQEDRYHQAGMVTAMDLKHAAEWEKLIHEGMGVPASKIEVQAGVGATTLTIHDLANRADAESVAQELRALAEKKKDKFGATKVEVRLSNAPATINPFVLPTEAPQAPVSPSSDLPTISLPPFRTDGR
jgi:hypothetical protein